MKLLMNRTISGTILLALSMLLLLPLSALAIPAISCHCFTERSYDPGRPAAADPYFLATTQNSFFAAAFSVDKKTVVMKKQLGSNSDDLWIAYWVASKAGVSPETLLQDKQGKENWKEVLSPLRLSSHDVGVRFSTALNTVLTPARLADAVVDELFLRHQLLPETELLALRQAGATNQELIVATVIAARMGKTARQVYQEVRGGSKTWGTLLQSAKIYPKDVPQEVANLLKLHPR